MPHVYGYGDLAWQKAGYAWALHCVGKQDALLHVVPDGVYPKMWRVRSLDGRLSDMANISWARDAAKAIACRRLNVRGDISPRIASPMRDSGEGLPH
jgi:hypothetical protein